jgi:hypothetical protein
MDFAGSARVEVSMANYRGTLFFSFAGPPADGWTEKVDFVAPDNSSAQTIFQQIVTARRYTLSQSIMLSMFKLATVAPKLSAKTTKYFLAQTKIFLCPDVQGGLGFLSVVDTPNAAVLVQVQYNGYSRVGNYQVRGIPDTWWDGGALTPAAQAVNFYFQFLQKIPMQLFHVNRTSGALTIYPMQCSHLQRISSRRTGRPFGQLRGRRRKKVA